MLGGGWAKLGRLLLRLFRSFVTLGLLIFILLGAACGYYFTQLEARAEKDYQRLVDKGKWETMKDRLGFVDKADYLNKLESGLKVVVIVCVLAIILLAVCWIGATVLTKHKGGVTDMEDPESSDEEAMNNGEGGSKSGSDSDSDSGDDDKKKKKV